MKTQSMEQKSREFVDAIVKNSPALQDVYRDNLEYWAPEEPPVTVLFGAIGSKIAEEFAEVGIETRTRIFAMIDDGLSDDGELGTAVATGMIEAIVNKAEMINLWEPICASFGQRSRYFTDAWFAQQARLAADLAS